MVAVTAAFAVVRRQVDGVERVMTVLTDLFDIDLRPYLPRGLPTYDEAVRTATLRALSRRPVCGFVPVFGLVQYVPVCERLALASAEELDVLAHAIRHP